MTVATAPPAPVAAVDPQAAVTLTYFAYFDIGDGAGDVADKRLRELATAPTSSILYTYDISTDTLYSGAPSPANVGWNILAKYRDDMYSSRIAPYARKHRFGQMYQLCPFTIFGLWQGSDTICQPNEAIQCQPVISLTNLGLGCVQLWLTLPGRHTFSDLIHLNDPSQVHTKAVELTLSISGRTTTLSREQTTIIEVLSFCAVQLLTGLDLVATSASPADWTAELRKATRLARATPAVPAFDNVETLALYHLDFAGSGGVDAATFAKLPETHGRELRALLTNDTNWRVKKTDMVAKALQVASCTTRDSILWYVTPTGAVKVYSDALETDQHTSMVLATFELEMLLGMRFFLAKMNYALNAISLDHAQPASLAMVHRSMIESMDSFFSFANCTKDTMAERIDRLKEAFQITRLAGIATEKLQVLSQLVAAHHDHRLQQSQNSLTIIFGVFGVAQLVLPAVIWLADAPPGPVIVATAASVAGSMVLVGSALLMWLSRRR